MMQRAIYPQLLKVTLSRSSFYSIYTTALITTILLAFRIKQS